MHLSPHLLPATCTQVLWVLGGSTLVNHTVQIIGDLILAECLQHFLPLHTSFKVLCLFLPQSHPDSHLLWFEVPQDSWRFSLKTWLTLFTCLLDHYSDVLLLCFVVFLNFLIPLASQVGRRGTVGRIRPGISKEIPLSSSSSPYQHLNPTPHLQEPAPSWGFHRISTSHPRIRHQ